MLSFKLKNFLTVVLSFFSYLFSVLSVLCVLFSISLSQIPNLSGQNKNPPKPECIPQPQKNTYGIANVYSSTPYKAGENIKYAVTYMGIFAGYGELNVLDPVKLGNSWVRHFEAQGVTGDWYKKIAFAKAKTDSLVDPLTRRGLQVNLNQETKKLFSDRKTEQRWLRFDHNNCLAHNKKIKTVNDQTSVSENDYYAISGTLDVLGATYWLREQKLKLGQELKVPVYSSKTNWWFKIIPLQEEEIKTPIRTFKTIKLKLDTYMGEQLEQSGDTFAWVSIDTVEKPIIQIQASLKIGSVKMLIDEYHKKKEPTKQSKPDNKTKDLTDTTKA